MNIADQLQISTIHLLLLLFQTAPPHYLSFISKYSPAHTYYSPTCFIGTLEYTKIKIFSILQLQWHGFSKRFYSRHKFMILSIKERYLVSVEHFLCYCSLLNF